MQIMTLRKSALTVVQTVSWALAIAVAVLSPHLALSRPLSVADVLALQTVDRADITPGSEDIAIAMPRPVGPGEVYGRNAYEIDPSRSDIWLAKRDGSDLRRLTHGHSEAAGYWCPHWSPDGQRLAMLSTAPSGGEPLGGNNARIYIWERADNALFRLSDRASHAQERFGSPLGENDLRGPGSLAAKSCRENQESAPFVWVDETRLLAVLMPAGERSPMVARYQGAHQEQAQTGQDIRLGQSPTISRSSSGLAALNADASEKPSYEAELIVFDLESGIQTSLGRIPAYPVYGALTIALSPDATQAVILAPRRAIPPHLAASPRLNFGTWAVEKALFTVDLEGLGQVNEVVLPKGAEYPVDVAGWSPNSKRVALRARSNTSRNEAALWTLETDTGALKALSPDAHVGQLTSAMMVPGNFAQWAGDNHVRAYIIPDGTEAAEGSWRLINVVTGDSAPFVSGVEGIARPIRLPDGTFAANSAGGPVRYNPISQRFEGWTGIFQAICDDRGALMSERRGDLGVHTLFATNGPQNASLTLDARARLLDHDCTGIVYFEEGEKGSVIRFAEWGSNAMDPKAVANDPDDEGPITLMTRDAHLADVTWGERRLIDYTHEDGSARKVSLLLPPDYDAARAYPTLFWVYTGYSPRSTESFEFDRRQFLPHNLHVFAAQGYIVAVPSIPISRGKETSELFKAAPAGVLPALDTLIELGITDEARVGVMGHSFGGYTVNALVAQTERFAAAASLAGASDLAINHSVFDPTARGWPGIEQDFYVNDGIYETGANMKVDPGVDPDLYHRNSPLTYVDNITTPLLIAHGELDIRAPLTQPEALYSLLRRRGRTARLLRYWGENHSLANSPANARDLMEELFAWFDTHLLADGDAPLE